MCPLNVEMRSPCPDGRPESEACNGPSSHLHRYHQRRGLFVPLLDLRMAAMARLELQMKENRRD
jgi:hypothetical protein